MNAPTVDTRFSASQPHAGRVRVDAPRHAGSPVMCIGKNATLTPTNISPNTQRPSRSDSALRLTVRHPVIERGEQREHHAADQHVVQVRDDEVGVVRLPVERHHRDHHAGQPAEHEDEEEAEHEQRRRRDARPAPLASVAIQANTWMPLGIATAMLAASKNASDSCGMPVANMWCTHSPKLRKPIATAPARPAGSRPAACAPSSARSSTPCPRPAGR